MAAVYILYSASSDRYYIGSCKNFQERLQQHKDETYGSSYTAHQNNNDWELFYLIEDLPFEQARKIEQHIKRMKSRKYLHDLRKFPEMAMKLKSIYH